MEQEVTRQEGRWKALHHQFSQLQQEVHVRTTPVPNPGLSGSTHQGPASPSIQPTSQDSMQSSSSTQPTTTPIPHQNVYSGLGHSTLQREPHLQQLSEVDDIEHYPTTFERIAVACRWQTTDWEVKLVPLLTGKARSAYVHMEIVESLDYQKVKIAILQCCSFSRCLLVSSTKESSMDLLPVAGIKRTKKSREDVPGWDQDHK